MKKTDTHSHPPTKALRSHKVLGSCTTELRGYVGWQLCCPYKQKGDRAKQNEREGAERKEERDEQGTTRMRQEGGKWWVNIFRKICQRTEKNWIDKDKRRYRKRRDKRKEQTETGRRTTEAALSSSESALHIHLWFLWLNVCVSS